MFSFGIEPSITSTNGSVGLAARGRPERRQELLAAERGREHLVVQVDLREPRDRAEQHVLDLRLAGGRDRDRVTVAAHPLRDPEDVDLLNSGHWVLLPSSGRPRSVPRRGPAAHPGFRRPRRRAGKSGSSLSTPQARQTPAAGTNSMISSAPSATVPSATRLKAKVSESGTTWRRCPSLTSTLSIRRSPACAQAIRTIGVGDRELVHQQILGSGIADQLVHHPLAAEGGLDQHHAGRLGLDLADVGEARPAAGRRARRRRPRWRRTSGRCRAARRRRRPRARPGSFASSISIATPASRASSFRTDATPPRVASRSAPDARPEDGVDGRPQRAGVGDDLVGLEVELAAREHDRGAVRGDRAGEQDPVAGPRGLERRARVSCARARSS